MVVGLPGLLSALVEPAIGVLADSGRRRMLLLGGAAAYAAALLITAAVWSLPSLLLAMIVLYPASGAFVGLSQGTLVDLDPARHERRMLAWSLAGGAGSMVGPVLLAAAVAAGGGWRPPFVVLAILTVVLAVGARRIPMDRTDSGSPTPALVAQGNSAHNSEHGSEGTDGGEAGDDGTSGEGGEGGEDGETAGTPMWRRVLAALRAPRVARLLVVLQLTDLLGDVFLGFLALYLLDVARTGVGEAMLAVSVWTGGYMAGEALLLGPLRRVPGRRWMRASALATTVAFPVFLLATGPWGAGLSGWSGASFARLGLLALLGIGHAGWYALPKSWLFAALPGRSGTALALESLASFVGYLLPPAIGLLASAVGLDRALWALLLAPIAVLVMVPDPGERPC